MFGRPFMVVVGGSGLESDPIMGRGHCMIREGNEVCMNGRTTATGYFTIVILV